MIAKFFTNEDQNTLLNKIKDRIAKVWKKELVKIDTINEMMYE